MSNRAGYWGSVVVVLAQVVSLSGCGGSAEEGRASENSDDAGGNGAATKPSDCGDILIPAVVIEIAGAPTDGGQCLASLKFEPPAGEGAVACMAQGDDCSCWMTSGNLLEGETTITVLDPSGFANATYNGPYVPAASAAPCGGPEFEGIVIDYNAVSDSSGSEVPVSCERSGISEFCSSGEGCCNCGCGVVTDSCLQESICMPHSGPACGGAMCREGTICCDADQGFCAKSQADCPQ